MNPPDSTPKAIGRICFISSIPYAGMLLAYWMVIQMLSPLSRAASMALMSRCSQMREFTTMPSNLFSPTRILPYVPSCWAARYALHSHQSADKVCLWYKFLF